MERSISDEPSVFSIFRAHFKKILHLNFLGFIGLSHLPAHLRREQNGKFGLIDSRGENQPSAISLL